MNAELSDRELSKGVAKGDSRHVAEWRARYPLKENDLARARLGLTPQGYKPWACPAHLGAWAVEIESAQAHHKGRLIVLETGANGSGVDPAVFVGASPKDHRGGARLELDPCHEVRSPYEYSRVEAAFGRPAGHENHYGGISGLYVWIMPEGMTRADAVQRLLNQGLVLAAS